MKKNTLFSFIVLFGFITLVSCKNDEGPEPSPSQEEAQAQKLISTWVIGEEGSVSRDDISSNEWKDFTITFTENTYTTTNTYKTVWPEQGNWQFVEGDINKIKRDDGLIIDIEVGETTLGMTFLLLQNSQNARLNGVQGEYSFRLIKQ